MYIGESENIPKRWLEHITDLVSKEHCNQKLQNDFNTYGIKNFKFNVIETYRIDDTDKDNSVFKLKMTLICREHLYIQHFDTIQNGYNIVDTFLDTIKNHKDIFVRDEKADSKSMRMIYYFLKNNPQVLNIKHEVEDNFIKNIAKEKKPKKSNKKKSTKKRYLSSERKYLENKNLLSYITPCINDEIFKKILESKGLIIHNAGYEPTQYSFDNGYMINGGILKNKSGESFIRPIVTELGEKKIIDIFKSSTILEDTLKVIDNTAMKNNYYKCFNK